MGTAYERLHRLITRIGAWPSAIEPDTHDVVMASVSPPAARAGQRARRAGRARAGRRRASGCRRPARRFRDVTRVAGANSVIWGGIYRANADALVAAIDDMVARLQDASATCSPAATTPASRDWNDAAREDRRRLLESDLAGGEVHELRVLVPNRPGIVAEIALALGRATIDIVDMGLYPELRLARHGRAVDPRRRRRPAGRAPRPRPGPGGRPRVTTTRPRARVAGRSPRGRSPGRGGSTCR